VNWADRTRPLWRIGNRLEALELRHLGFSATSVLSRGRVLLLETTGRQSGRRRFTPVAFWEEGSSYLVSGGAAGMSRTPDWVANLRASSDAAVWLRRKRIAMVATELSGAERDAAREQAAAIWRGIPAYEKRSGRLVPYFRLTPDATVAS
jgi:deazaflavin-dependent oxidoreductase (nitroreductase family)